MSRKDAVLSVENLSVTLRNQSARLLDDISFAISPGEIFALVGESGSGKSVTSLAIMRLLPDALTISGGEVYMHQKNLFALTEREMTRVRGKKIAMIFQESMSSLNPVQPVGDQIAESLKIHTTLSGRALKDKVEDLLQEVGIQEPAARAQWYPYQLSGGQQQRVMIAMALACEPDVLLADEPTTALDVTIQQQILKLLKKLSSQRKLGTLLITHDMGVVQQMADRVGVMHKGQLIEQNDCGDFFANPQQKYSQHLINSLPSQAFQKKAYQRKIRNPILLEVKDLAVHFPVRKGLFQKIKEYTHAVNNVSFTLNKGETLALVGESGCGKTTVGRTILNLEKLTRGEIWFENHRLDILNRQNMMCFRQKIQVVFQNPFSSMNPRMTVGNIIEEGMISLRPHLTERQRQQSTIKLLQKVQLEPEYRFRYPHEFSGGQRQRIALARALAVEPELIICDEPTSALDVSTKAGILALLQQLQNELGVSYLFITHDLSIIPTLAHKVAIMHNGVIVEQGEAEQVMTQARHPFTRQLLAAVPVVELNEC